MAGKKAALRAAKKGKKVEREKNDHKISSKKEK
jgi:hypothetical protein